MLRKVSHADMSGLLLKEVLQIRGPLQLSICLLTVVLVLPRCVQGLVASQQVLLSLDLLGGEQLGRTFVPCWDDPWLRAVWTLTVQLPTNMSVLASTQQVSSSLKRSGSARPRESEREAWKVSSGLLQPHRQKSDGWGA
jgi:hypothetical protein